MSGLTLGIPSAATLAKAALAGVIALAGSVTAAWYSVSKTPADGGQAVVAMPASEELIEATTGEAATELAAVGETARQINAARPVSGPASAASPFFVGASARDRDRALLCLTQAVYYEAGYEPESGRRAVAQVVLNRVRHPAFPKSVCGVVYQSSKSRICQFTFVCDGALNRRPEAGAWRQARAIAQAALAGQVERSVGLATHYHADYVAPRWAPMLAKVRQIGTHIFYRWPGGWGRPAMYTARYAGELRDPASMRPAVLPAAFASGDPTATATAPGPPVRRAANDIGGLLDTSKGWTLSISDPRETESEAARVEMAQKRQKPPQPAAKPMALASAQIPPIEGK